MRRLTTFLQFRLCLLLHRYIHLFLFLFQVLQSNVALLRHCASGPSFLSFSVLFGWGKEREKKNKNERKDQGKGKCGGMDGGIAKKGQKERKEMGNIGSMPKRHRTSLNEASARDKQP